jgi:Protein of unknown function (DUF2851)
MLTERLLHFIWQLGYFNKTALETTVGEVVQIVFPGTYNSNQGPDFSDAKIIIGGTTWAGTVELHIKSSDWNKHKHTGDKNYNNVMLHVVWENDVSENSIPVLELNSRVSSLLLQRYEEWMNNPAFIPCGNLIHTVKEITWNGWKERLLIERLLRKSAEVEAFQLQNNHHWEETFWGMLARNFGIKVNADAFEAIAKSVSVNILAKHKNQIHQIEALLFGQAGLLNEKFQEDYPLLLQKEFAFLKHKHNLSNINRPVQFLRMRPGNFPTVRLAQLAMLITQSAHLFSKIKEASSVKELKTYFGVTANDYWHYHYKLDSPAACKPKQLGSDMIDNIIINTVVPVLFAYGNYHKEQSYKDQALRLLEQITAETNSITKGFSKLAIQSKYAFDSQALTELKNNYCNKKRCLDCSVGNALLKTDK